MILDTALGRLTAQQVGRSQTGAPVLRVLGIPYARARRFHPPAAVEASDRGTPINSGRGQCFPQRLMPRAANIVLRHFQLRPEWQPRHDVMGEDSLRVNVWTSGTTDPKPVLVFIHGGDCGSGTLPVYDGTRLAEQDIVVVTVAYRIGALGHLHVVDGERMSCDRGLLDQAGRPALGEEEHPRTGRRSGEHHLMGHCGGAQYALYQALNPDNNGLFHRLILCSGQRATPAPLDPDDERRAFADLLSDNRLVNYQELEGLPVKRLLRLRAPRAALSTTMDRPFFSTDPRSVLRDGGFPHVPVLIGTTADEFSMIDMPMWYKRMGIATRGRDLGRRVTRVYGEHGRRIAVELREESDGLADLQIRMMELVVFHGAALSLMDRFSRFTTVYGYRFEGVPEVYGGRPGSYHGAEVAFFFGNLDRMRIPVTEENRAVVTRLQGDWLAFIRDGAVPGRQAFEPGTAPITRYRDDGGVETIAFPHAGLLRDLEGSDLSTRVVNAYMRQR